MKKSLAVLVALAALGVSTTPAHAADPEKKTVRCKYKIARSLIALGKKQMRIRSECASRQALGGIHPGIDCLGDPVDGTSTGSATFDARLVAVRDRATALGYAIGKRCDAPYRSPETVAMHQLCDPPVTDRSGWDDILVCGYNLVTQASDRLSTMLYRRAGGGGEPITEEERLCRQAIGDAVRSAFRGRVRKRTDCFRHQEKTGEQHDCMATVTWPGRESWTGFPRADRALPRLLSDLRTAIQNFCSIGIEQMRFYENVSITDPTAGTLGGERFTSEDLFHVLNDEIQSEETKLITTMFPGLPRCGDGVIHFDRGEECDDGNRISCDGCDRDCTLSACLNGAACGPTEVCDDGNTLLQDGCNTSCELETCGDGILHPGLGEGCDDGNDVDCDGCDSNCTVSASCNNGIVCAAHGEECDEGLGVCLSGFDALAPCVDDSDCRGKCASGALAGGPCLTNTDCGGDGSISCVASLGCGGRCDGGADRGRLCSSDAECAGRCRPIEGAGQECADETECPLGMHCNTSNTCELPRNNLSCATDGECGTGGYCEPSNGCDFGNSNEVGDMCRDTCKLPACGDGVVDPGTDTNGLGGEECDDGNAVNGDGCDVNCTVTSCGNGIITAGEACDEGRGTCAGGYDDNQSCLYHTDCRGFCFDAPDIPCTWETAVLDCGGQTCFVSSGCMGGNADSPTCRPNCQLAGCGDGVVDPGEQCDDGPGTCVGGVDVGLQCAIDGDCRGICATGSFVGFPCFSTVECGGGACNTASCAGGNDDVADACRQTCELPTCGDGVKDTGEACDGADALACPGACTTSCTCP